MTASSRPPDIGELAQAVAALQETMALAQTRGRFDAASAQEVIARMRGLAEAVRQLSDDVDQAVLQAEEMYREIYG